MNLNKLQETMDNKYIKILLLLCCFINFDSTIAQNKLDPILNLIPKEYFKSSSPSEKQSLNVYSCTKCPFEIEYIRDQTDNNYHDFFIINKKTFNINESLDQQGIDFYNVLYLNKKYLFVSSIDSEIIGKGSSFYKNYYLFILDKQNNVLNYKQLIRSKKKYFSAFIFLINVKKTRTVNNLRNW